MTTEIVTNRSNTQKRTQHPLPCPDDEELRTAPSEEQLRQVRNLATAAGLKIRPASITNVEQAERVIHALQLLARRM